MALEHLLAAMEKEAAARAKAMLDAAREEAGGIMAVAEARVARSRAEEVDAVRARLDEEMHRALALERREVRAAVLQSRQAFLDQVLEAAHDGLARAAGQADYHATLSADLETALGYLGDAEARIRTSPGLEKIVAGITAGKRGIRIEPDDTIRAGFRVEAADGSVQVDQTLDQRLRDRWPALRIEVLAAPGGGPDADR
ncbi:MAG: V-type ATP synthase subunit E [Gemmatimonadales bacterium]